MKTTRRTFKIFRSEVVREYKLGKYLVRETKNGTYWCYKGLIHRENGPAVVESYDWKAWYKHGFRHREDGPAIVFDNGLKKKWFFKRERIYRTGI